jgi:phosphatidate cytidylyltransferase
MLMKRILTAIILIPLILAGLFYLPPSWFCIVTGVISLGAAWEWSHLMELKSIAARLFYVVISAFVFSWILFIPVSAIFVAAFIWWLVACLMVLTYPRRSAWWSKTIIARGMMGLFVIAPCWAAINFMRNQNDGIYALLFLLILICSADTAAYFTGRIWGKHKLAPLVSPGKTWEGFAGALIFSLLIVFVTLWLCSVPVSIWPWAILLSLVTVVFSIVGDLFESMIKRNAGVKDSGTILPGHGGLLDRIDSLTAAAPIFVFGGLMLGMYLD